MPVLPTLLPAASGGRAAGGSAGHLEGGVPSTESRQRRQHGARLQPGAGTTLPPHCGAGMEMIEINVPVRIHKT